MSDAGFSAASLVRLEERLRQERETFDQRKQHEQHWFALRLRMGYTAALMLPAIAFVCGYILLSFEQFNSTIVTSAGAALFVDVLGLVAAVWKVVLNAGSVTKLEPVTGQDVDDF